MPERREGSPFWQVVPEPEGSPGDGGPAGDGAGSTGMCCSAPREVSSGRWNSTRTGVTSQSLPSPCPPRVPVLSLPALPRLVWVLPGAGFPCPGPGSQGRGGAGTGGWWGQIRLLSYAPSAVLRATCIFRRMEWSGGTPRAGRPSPSPTCPGAGRPPRLGSGEASEGLCVLPGSGSGARVGSSVSRYDGFQLELEEGGPRVAVGKPTLQAFRVLHGGTLSVRRVF